MAKHYICPTPNPDGTDTDRRIELHWQRDLGVQLATTKRAEGDAGVRAAAALRDLNEARAVGNVHDITQAEDAYSTALARAEEPEWSGQFVDLSREQINHLIKQLRVARDQAFGRDE